MPAPKSYHVLEIFNLPPGTAKLQVEDRRKVIRSMIKSAGPEGFAKDANAHTASITALQELAVVSVLFWMMGGPFFILFGMLGVLVFGSYTAIVVCTAITVFLAYHPLPNARKWLEESEFITWMYRYFSYRFVWVDDATEQSEKLPVWIGAGAPHGVMPFSNILSIPAINTFSFFCREGGADYSVRKFRGAAASAIFRTPLLRYFSLFGCIDVSAKSITRAVDREQSVGIVLDGIAGIFRCNHDDEVVHVKSRKGLAKLALRNGIPLVAAYSVGNTEVFRAGFDRWGVMEWVSRKLQVSLFFLWGRYFLPIPIKCNVALLFGKPIMVKKMAPEDIRQEDIDGVHTELMASMEELFNQHKDHLGWGHKQIIFE